MKNIAKILLVILIILNIETPIKAEEKTVLEKLKEDIVDLEKTIKDPQTRYYAVNINLYKNLTEEKAFALGKTIKDIYLLEFPYCEIVDPALVGVIKKSYIISATCVTIK